MLEDDRVAIARKCRGIQQFGAMATEKPTQIYDGRVWCN